jgi:hypothetical protein
MSASTTAKRLTTRGAMIAWGVAVLVGGSALMANHLLSLPAPSPRDEALRAAIDRARPASLPRGWSAVHVFAAECGCSKRLVDHLEKRGPAAGVFEKVVMVGDDPAIQRRLERRGFSFQTVTPDELAARYHVEAVPLLVVAAPDGAVRYAGGYTERKQGPAIRDLDILQSLRAEHAVRSLPLFGCAVTEALKKTLDPFGLK